MKILLLFFALIWESSALFGIPTWNTLRTTWGPFILQSHIFEEMPLTENEAQKTFQKLPTSTDCKGTFLGYRYIRNNDPAVVLLYDSNGCIAGIQTGLPKNLITSDLGRKWFQNNDMFVDDNINGTETYTLTAYFRDPNNICSDDQKECDADGSSIGTKLSFQTRGTGIVTDKIKIPMDESDLENDDFWTKGKCFPSMGVHYWGNLKPDMDCNNFFPAFLLFNDGKLTGFGWAIQSGFTFSDKYEHPPAEVLKKFMEKVPQCLLDNFKEVGGFTTMHTYMNAKLWHVTC